MYVTVLFEILNSKTDSSQMNKNLTTVYLSTKTIHEPPDGYSLLLDTHLFHYIWSGSRKLIVLLNLKTLSLSVPYTVQIPQFTYQSWLYVSMLLEDKGKATIVHVHATNALRWNRGIATLLNLATRCRRVVNFMLRSGHARERTPNPHTQWMGNPLYQDLPLIIPPLWLQ